MNTLPTEPPLYLSFRTVDSLDVWSVVANGERLVQCGSFKSVRSTPNLPLDTVYDEKIGSFITLTCIGTPT